MHARQLSTLPPEVTIFGIAAAAGVWTPYGAALLLRSLSYTSSIIETVHAEDKTEDVQAE